MATELDHPYSRTYALHHAAVLELWREGLGRLLALAQELLQVANTHDYPIWRALALVIRGTAGVGTGEVEAGLADRERGFTLCQGTITPPVFWRGLLMVRAGT